MQIINIDGFNARCEAKGVSRDVSLFLLQGTEINCGDFVLVHVGYAIQVISTAYAKSAWELYDEISAAKSSPTLKVEPDHA